MIFHFSLLASVIGGSGAFDQLKIVGKQIYHTASSDFVKPFVATFMPNRGT